MFDILYTSFLHHDSLKSKNVCCFRILQYLYYSVKPTIILLFRFLLFLGGYRVIISDPEIIRSVAVTNCQKFARSDFVTKVIPGIEKGLFAVNGRVHAHQKRMIGPVFKSSNLRGFLDVFNENAEKLLQVIKQLYKNYIKKTSLRER